MTSALAIQRSRAEAVAHAIAARLPAGAVTAIFAGGSLGRGEVWAARIGDALEIYSDVDLYVVVDRPERRAAVLEAARETQARIPSTPGVDLLRGVDVGIYTRSDLLAQPVRPGTADLGVRHLLLHGDRAIMLQLAAAMSRPMSPLESLYLLENRARELAAAQPGPGGPSRLLAVTALKGRLDAGVAHLVAAGMYVPLASKREERLQSAPPDTLAATERDRVSAAFADARDLDAYVARADARREAGETMRVLAASWRAIAARLFALAGGTPGALVARRCGAGSRLGHARELVRMRHAARRGLPYALAAGMRLSALSPRCALRVQALCEEMARGGAADAASLGSHRAHVEALTRALGFARGELTRRADDAYALVTGEAR